MQDPPTDPSRPPDRNGNSLLSLSSGPQRGHDPQDESHQGTVPAVSGRLMIGLRWADGLTPASRTTRWTFPFRSHTHQSHQLLPIDLGNSGWTSRDGSPNLACPSLLHTNHRQRPAPASDHSGAGYTHSLASLGPAGGSAWPLSKERPVPLSSVMQTPPYPGSPLPLEP